MDMACPGHVEACPSSQSLSTFGMYNYIWLLKSGLIKKVGNEATEGGRKII